MDQTEREGDRGQAPRDERPYVVERRQDNRQRDQRLDHARRNSNHAEGR